MKIIDIVLKDLKIILSDKKATLILIAMPLILIAILGNALGSSFIQDGNTDTIEIAIVKEYDAEKDLDRFTEFLKSDFMSMNISNDDVDEIVQGVNEFDVDKIFTEDFLESDDIKNIIKYEILDEEAALQKLNDNEISAIVILPESFLYDMYMNFFMPFRNEIEIRILGHPDKFISSQLVEGIMTGFFDGVSSIIIGKNVFLEVSMDEGIGNKTYESMGYVINDITKSMNNFNVIIEDAEIEGIDSVSGLQYYSAAMAAMFILYSASNGGELLLAEKKQVTYQRMTIGGVANGKIVFGKYLAIFFLTLIQLTIMILFTRLVYRVNWGAVPNVILITLCTAFSAAGIGMLIASITFRSDNYKASNAFQSVIVHIMSFLGGSYIPMDMFPESVQLLGNLSPNGLTLKAYLNTMQGGGLSEISAWLLGLIVIGIVLLAVSIYILKGAKEVSSNVKHNQNKISQVEA